MTESADATPFMRYRELLRVEGVNLEPTFHVREIALQRRHALAAIRLLRDAAVPILGGDVWVEQDGQIERRTESWTCNRRSGEDAASFVARSFDKANRYVETFPE